MTKKCICVPIWGLFLAFAITAVVQVAGMSSGSLSNSHVTQVSKTTL